MQNKCRQEEVFIIIMKLTFTNKKENKNCLYFIRALHEIEKHNLKDSRKPVYMYVSKEEMRMAPSLADLHKERLEDACLVSLKPDVFNIVFDDNVPFKIFNIGSSKLLKAFTKNDNKVTLIELKTTNRGITVMYESDNSDVICFLNIESEELEDDWPEHPLSTREHFFQVINVCRLGEIEIRSIDMRDQEELWVQFIQEGLCVRTSRGKVRKEGRAIFKQQAEYNYMTIKNKLRSRRFLNLKGDYFLSHLTRCLKKKRASHLYIKNICDRHQENQVRQSYLVLETKTEFGTIFKMVGCFISQQMGEEGEEAIRRQIQVREREMPKESYLLKSEQNNSQQVRNMVLNRFNQVDGEAMIAEGIYKEKRPIGKIQEGQQTFTRKFQSIY